MKVKALYDNFKYPELENEIKKSLKKEKFPMKYKNYIQQQVLLTVGKEYEVFALCNFEGSIDFQIIDDYEEFASWYPSFLFEIIDNTMPKDWICNCFSEEPSLVIGPEFIAKDINSYADMVENNSPQEDLFWKRVERLRNK